MIDARRRLGNPTIRDLREPDFQRIASIMLCDTGIDLPLSKLSHVQSRLLRRLKALDLDEFSTYCDLVEDRRNVDERLEMYSVLTTNVTGFFRENHHFDYMRLHCIPALMKRLEMGQEVRIWSAGCSSGEEPFSLALTFLSEIPNISDWDFKILATDIDPLVLSTAAAGVYDNQALRAVPSALRQAYFLPDAVTPDRSRLRPEVRKLVAFRRLNLVEPWPMKRKFDVIMCRNVVIYFGDAAKAEIWARMIAQLHPDGWLFTGHSERLNGQNALEMDLLYTTTYRPKSRMDMMERRG